MLPIDHKELIFMIGELSIENKQLKLLIKKLTDRPVEGKPSDEGDKWPHPAVSITAPTETT